MCAFLWLLRFNSLLCLICLPLPSRGEIFSLEEIVIKYLAYLLVIIPKETRSFYWDLSLVICWEKPLSKWLSIDWNWTRTVVYPLQTEDITHCGISQRQGHSLTTGRIPYPSYQWLVNTVFHSSITKYHEGTVFPSKAWVPISERCGYNVWLFRNITIWFWKHSVL